MAAERDFTETCEYLADEMDLDGKDREKFMDECHRRAGYNIVSTYVKDGDESGSKRNRETRNDRKGKTGGNDDKPRTVKTWFGEIPSE